MKKNLKNFFIITGNAIRSGFFKLVSSRIALVGAVLVVMLAIVVVRLFNLQIVQSAYYTENFTQKAQKTITTEAARGNIYDRNGYLLAYSTISYSVTITDEIPSSDERGDILNGIAYRTVNIIEENGDTITTDFNIELDENGEYAFKSDPSTSQTTFLINVFGVTSDELEEEGYDEYSADEVMSYIIEKFGISSAYTKEETVKIATIRYALSLVSYQKYVATEIATDVSEETKAAILEAADELTGVEISESYKRVYNDAEYFAHIIGYTGEISESELEEYNLDNDAGITYEAGDIVGKSGVEQTYDSYLQGTKGTKDVFVDSTGNILEVIEETDSESGNDLYLTIDRDLQVVAYTVLEKKLAACLINKIVNYDYESDQEKQTYVYIPIKDVYAQMLTNIIDFTEFSDDDASEREKETYASFCSYKEVVLAEILSELETSSPTSVGDFSDEYNEYFYYIYDLLGEEDILDKDAMDTSNSVYLEWADESTSLQEFLQTAISENWINVNGLDSGSQYSDSEEIYELLVDKIMELLEDDREFAEMIYYYMIYAGEIDPYDICLMLYDQEIIEYDDAYESLVNGEYDTYTFVITQIENLVLTPAMIALDPCSGSLCITDVDTGKVLALVSYPSYDNNLLSGQVDVEYWYELNNNDSQPLYNYSTMALTAPGSTFKMCTAVAALAEDYITTETTIYDAVEFDLITPSPKCYISPASHGYVNVSTALEGSCNYFFYQIGYDMGLDENGEYNSAQALDILTEYAEQLGLGIKSGVEISEASPRVSTTDSVRSAIGQGTNGYAVVHLARYVNTIAGSGYNYSLSLIDRVDDSEGDTIVEAEPELTNIVELEDEEWDAIHYGMSLVTTSGTASSFFTDLEVSVSGKTGTAEEDLYRSNHANFVGYAPSDDPEISFACTIRNSDSTSYPGGVLSEVLQYYFGEMTYDEVMSLPVENNIEGFHSE